MTRSKEVSKLKRTHFVLRLIFWLVLTLIAPYSLKAGAKVVVYYDTEIPIKEREKVLKAYTGEEELIVFARSKDFHNALNEDSVPVVIAPFSFESEQSDYKPVIQFGKSGKTAFRYKAITLPGTKINLSNLDAVTWGIIEEGERQKLKGYFKRTVGINLVKITTVTKLQDLLPLLVYKSADAVIIAESDYKRMSDRFGTKTIEINLKSNEVYYPRVYIKNGTKSEIIAKLETIDQGSLKSIGFDQVTKVLK